MLRFDRVHLPESSDALRAEVRRFLAEQAEHLGRPNSDFASGHDPEFSARLGERGWIGMTWPRAYGGQERSFLDRYVVTEELLAAGAPVSAHWIADRQSGPLLLRYGTEAQRQRYLPSITRGESFFSIGMSEPDTGSDLASVRSTAKPHDDGWLVNGTKLWTTDAHRNHYMIALVRTEPPSEQRHAGLSQILIDLRNDGARIRPIRNMAGADDFSEVVFEDVLVPHDRIVGEPGRGWVQVTSELAYERSGPERFLSTLRLFLEMVRTVGDSPAPVQAQAVGCIAAHLCTLRRMSISVACMLDSGESPEIEAALVKEMGNGFEKRIPEIARLALPMSASADGSGLSGSLRDAYAESMLSSPAFTIRGGTREILRGVIARGMGLR